MAAECTPAADDLLPPGLAVTIERKTRGSIVAIEPRAGGGASRSGAVVTLSFPNDQRVKGYLSFDNRGNDPDRMAGFRREYGILTALSGDLSDYGLRCAELLFADPEHMALMTALVPGEARFTGFRDAAEEEATARDFMRQLALLHRIPASAASGAEIGDASMAISTRIRQQLDELFERNLQAVPDPIFLLAIDWAQANIPANLGDSAIVHGDAGPGNFLHRNGRVEALIDWELVHYGDPAEDLAQIWVRSLFQPFIAPAKMLDYYADAGGECPELSRIEYHRLLFQLSFTVDRQASFDGFGAPPANIGNNMLYHTIHMRILVEELARLSGVPLAVVALPDCPEVATTRGFDFAIDDIRQVIVPRIADEQAAVKAKSLARMLKYWRARDRFGARYDAQEIAEIAAALNTPLSTVTQARQTLADAILEHRIDWETAVTLCHGRVMRETELMGDALGSLKHCHYAPLE